MKTHQSRHRLSARLLSVALMVASTFTVMAQQGQIGARPLTPQEIKDYALDAATQTSGGLFTVGLGQPVYLEAQIRTTVAATNILGVTWELTAKPIGSAATLEASPLPANMPIYSASDRSLFRLAGRQLLRPDVTGTYTVTATVDTNGGNLVLTREIHGATYMGSQTCQLCHSGGQIAEDMYTPWSQTPHATAFTRAIDGLSSSHFSQNCTKCHVVGFDTHPSAVNGGFDDVAAQTGWTFPTVLTNGNWAAMPAALKNVSNIQCESCHGPGSQHAYSLGDAGLISKTFGVGSCAQCHDSLTHHPKTQEWNNSGHAVMGSHTGQYCGRCHTAQGFVNHLEGKPPVVTPYEPHSCATCHDPHDATNPHQLRTPTVVTLDEGTTVTTAGSGALCMNCHQSRNGSITNSLVNWPQGLPTWAGGSSFGLHDGPQASMLMGVNGETYGKVVPSAAHGTAVANTCVGCHMQEVDSSHPAFGKAGGHTMKMSYETVTGGVTNRVDLVDACVKCHGPMESFNLARVDYNGDGIIEGIQTEVSKLKDKLSTLLPPPGYKENPADYVADGLVKQSTSEQRNWPLKFLKGAYNFRLVRRDTSLGIHNPAYTVALLKASIADLTGDGNEDGLPDEWQIQYFGSASHPNAAPNATPAGDGVPNWLKYALGVDPLVPGVVLPDGVVWANAGPTDGAANTIQVYTAAEVAFNTEVGKTYQLQAISNLGGGWQDVGAPVAGTGNSYSFVTSTRNNAQQFFRVVSTP